MASTTAETSGGAGGPLGLDGLIALNDEIVALVRAGVPLDRGLRDAAVDLGGRSGRLAGTLGERLARGEGLVEALAAEGDRLPPIYKAVVAAGLRSGRLAVALEGLAAYARGFADLRRAVGLALVYPLTVMVLAYGLFLGFIWGVAPRFLAAFRSLGVRASGPVVWLAGWERTLPFWGPVLPLLLLFGWIWWRWSGRASALSSGFALGPIGAWPWLRRMLVNTRAANFAELLALLIDHGVPLHEAVGLAAGATGDARLRRAAEAVAEADRRGEPLSRSVRRTLPPLLGWLMTAGAREGAVGASLRHAAALYRQRALNQADLIRSLLPVVLLVFLGGVTALFYGLTLVVPMTELLSGLAME